MAQHTRRNRTDRAPRSDASRTGGGLKLWTTTPADHPAGPSETPEPVLGRLPAAVGGAIVAALAGWVLVAGFAVIGWLPVGGGAEEAELADALALGTRLWHLGHGAGISMAGATWTLMPLGITVLVWIIVRGAAAFASRQSMLAAQLDRDPGQADDTDEGDTGTAADAELPLRDRIRSGVSAGGLLLGCYLVLVLGTAVIVGGVELGRLAVGAVALAGTATVAGVSHGIHLDPAARLPWWLRPVPRAVLASQLVLLAAAAAALLASQLFAIDQSTALAAALGGGLTATVALTALQVAYLPTVMIWTGSWMLGAGFTVGESTVVSPADTQLGLLPAVPLTSALPPEGPGIGWDFAWIAAGVLAGAMAAVMVVRARPRARFDETALVGGLAGAMSGLLFAGVAVLARGDLGSGRLVDLGPRLLELLAIAPALLGLSGMVVGFVWGLIRRPRKG